LTLRLGRRRRLNFQFLGRHLLLHHLKKKKNSSSFRNSRRKKKNNFIYSTLDGAEFQLEF
jgi:hypothetical protein